MHRRLVVLIDITLHRNVTAATATKVPPLIAKAVVTTAIRLRRTAVESKSNRSCNHRLLSELQVASQSCFSPSRSYSI